MSPGRRTILEFFILEGIFQHCEVEDAETLTILYNAITEFADIFECQLPLYQKNLKDIEKFISEHQHNIKAFETLCCAQLSSPDRSAAIQLSSQTYVL